MNNHVGPFSDFRSAAVYHCLFFGEEWILKQDIVRIEAEMRKRYLISQKGRFIYMENKNA